MRQHAILSCLVLLFGWGLFFGVTLLQTINVMPEWSHKILSLSVIPLCLCMALWHRQKCRGVVFRANFWGFLGLLCLLGGRLYADLMQQTEWQLLSILLMLPFIILASLGFRAWWAWCFPSFAVLFAYPGLHEFSAWLQTKMMHIVPLSTFSIHWIVITAFYGYLRYRSLGQRLLFYTLSMATFVVLIGIQAYGLSRLLYWGGNELLSQFNLLQLNQVLMVLGICFLGYAISVLAPYKPPMRRMMNDNTDFMILIDRHSDWLAMTVVVLAFMGLSVWLSGNIHRMSLVCYRNLALIS
jgi:hypothetical protein